MKPTRIVSALFLICFAAVFAFSQEKDKKAEQKPLEIKANVNVLDAAGNPVGDVKLEDLKIFEDGVEQKITFFEKKESVLNLGFVMDNTGSMRLRLDDIIQYGSTLIDNLQTNDKAFIVRFISNDKIEMVQDWSSDKAKLKRAMNNLFIEGGQSAVIDGLYAAVKVKLQPASAQNPNQRHAIILISDAENRASFYNLGQLLDLIKGTGIQVFSVALTSDLTNEYEPISKTKNVKKNAEFLVNMLALETGGAAFVMGRKKDLDSIDTALKAITAELHSPYIIGYAPANQKRNGEPRKLRIEVAVNAKGEKRQGLIRESFVVPKD